MLARLSQSDESQASQRFCHRNTHRRCFPRWPSCWDGDIGNLATRLEQRCVRRRKPVQTSTGISMPVLTRREGGGFRTAAITGSRSQLTISTNTPFHHEDSSTESRTVSRVGICKTEYGLQDRRSEVQSCKNSASETSDERGRR